MTDLEHFKSLYPTTKLMLFSLVTGTLLFILHMMFPRIDEIIVIGIFYVIGIFVINLFGFFHLLLKMFNSSQKELFLIRIVIVLSNIPIAIFYLYIIIENL